MAWFLAYERTEAGNQRSMERRRKELQSSEERAENARLCWRRILRLMKEMEEHRTVARMRKSPGNYVKDKIKMPSLLKKFWNGVMQETPVTVEECTHYLYSMPFRRT